VAVLNRLLELGDISVNFTRNMIQNLTSTELHEQYWIANGINVTQRFMTKAKAKAVDVQHFSKLLAHWKEIATIHPLTITAI
jgi:hypothetical protein